MNSFDSMIERYKKELIDAKKRSIFQQLKELAEPENEAAASLTETQKEYGSNEPLPVSAAFAAGEEPETENEMLTEKEPEPPQLLVREEPVIQKYDAPAAESRENGQALGSLKVQVFMAGRAYPVSSANVIITGEDGKVYFDGFTDSNGAITRLLLPAPKKQFSQSPQTTPPYAQYDIFVSHPRFQSRRYLGVPVFSGVESIQNIQLLPLGTDEKDSTDVRESEPDELLMRDGERNA